MPSTDSTEEIKPSVISSDAELKHHSRYEGLAIALITVFMVFFYFWTVVTNGDSPVSLSSTFYPDLATSFTKGHLYMPQIPRPELLALPDPYDPNANVQYAMHDASLYKGRYYIYFGPAPAVIFFAPFHILTSLNFRQAFAVAIFCSLGFLASKRLFTLIIQDYYPGTPLLIRLLCLASLGLGTVCPYLLRRPDVYEVAISCGYWMMQLAFLQFYLSQRNPRELFYRLVVVSLCIGLAAASRLNYIMASFVFAGFVLWIFRQRLFLRKPALGSPILVMMPLGVIGCLLALYNYERFDSPFEFGAQYTMSGDKQQGVRFFALENIPYNLWFYFLAAPDFTWKFPFIHAYACTRFALPSTYMRLEPTVGLFVITPISLLAFSLPFQFFKFEPPLRISLLFIALSTAAACMLIFTFSGGTMRYLCDFAPTFTILGCVAACHLLSALELEKSRIRSVSRIFLGALLAWGCFCGMCLGFTGYFDAFRLNSPVTYAIVAQAFRPIEIVAHLASHLYH